MKLLYITTVPFNFKLLDGIQKKILNQLKCFSERYEVELLCRTDNSIILVSIPTLNKKKIDAEISRKGLLNKGKEWMCDKKYDTLYIRYPKSDPYLLNLLKAAKDSGVKAVMELPTYPYNKEGLENLSGKLKACVDRIYRKKVKKYLSRIITYSNDSQIFGVQTINTSNGIDFSNISFEPRMQDNEIHLIAVSSMYRVHGYERIIEGLGKYYSSAQDKDTVILDLVGEGDFILLYKELVSKLELQKYVIFHGRKFNDELKALYQKANIGLNSLAIHRQGLKNESTLKTKEYAAYGLPIVSSSYVDAFTDQDNEKYVLRVSPDDSAISIDAIVEFYKNLQNGLGREQLRKNIREAAKDVCDMRITLKPIIDFIDEKKL